MFRGATYAALARVCIARVFRITFVSVSTVIVLSPIVIQVILCSISQSDAIAPFSSLFTSAFHPSVTKLFLSSDSSPPPTRPSCSRTAWSAYE